MASSFEIAGGGCKAAAFFGRDLLWRPRRCFPSLRVNSPTQWRRPIPAAALAFKPWPAPLMTTSLSPARPDSLTPFTGRSRDERNHATPQKLDEWMRESVTEIVRNIGEAPFLVQIFSEEEDQMNGETESRLRPTSSPPRLMLEREAATAESWTGMKKRWEDESCVPDGIILVEELCNDEDNEEDGAAMGAEDGEGRRSGKRWGVVIQGRGMDSSACYILDTCRVRSSLGFCTHFCLVRAKCFGEHVRMQFKKAWLQQER